MTSDVALDSEQIIYAQLQVVGQAIRETGGVDDVKAGALGEWAAHDAAVQRYQLLLGMPPAHEFTIPGRDLTVTVFPGLSVISGTADALASVRDLRATAFVNSLPETRAQRAESGSLGAGNSLLARDPDGMPAKFVETSGGTA